MRVKQFFLCLCIPLLAACGDGLPSSVGNWTYFSEKEPLHDFADEGYRLSSAVEDLQHLDPKIGKTETGDMVISCTGRNELSFSFYWPVALISKPNGGANVTPVVIASYSKVFSFTDFYKAFLDTVGEGLNSPPRNMDEKLSEKLASAGVKRVVGSYTLSYSMEGERHVAHTADRDLLSRLVAGKPESLHVMAGKQKKDGGRRGNGMTMIFHTAGIIDVAEKVLELCKNRK